MYQTYVSIVDLRLAVLKTGICRRSGGYHLNLSKKSRVLCVSPVVALISSPISNLVMYQTFVSIVDLRLAVLKTGICRRSGGKMFLMVVFKMTGNC
jgi:hypothetical protein